MLRTQQLTFTYQGGPSFSFPDVQCAAGEHLLLIGESGRGKTTLLHLLAGLLTPQAGSIELNQTDMSRLSGRALDHFRGQHIGIVFQTSHFIQSLSVEDNLLLPQYLSGRTVSRGRAPEVLQRLGLAEKLHKKPSQLSVGEQQRVAIARAVMNRPALLLADEPTSALDDKNAAEVTRLLEEQAAEAQSALVIVTHDKRLKDRFSQYIEL